MNDIISRNRSVYQKLSAVYFWLAALFGVVALLSTGSGLLTLRTSQSDAGGIVFGIFTGLFSVVLFVFSRRFRAK